jgi:hypothetical protein
MKFIDGLTLTDRDTRKTSNIFFSDCQIAFSSSTRLYPPLIERHQPRLSQRVTVASCKSSATAYTGRDELQKGTQHRVRTSRRPWQPISRTRYALSDYPTRGVRTLLVLAGTHFSLQSRLRMTTLFYSTSAERGNRLILPHRQHGRSRYNFLKKYTVID